MPNIDERLVRMEFDNKQFEAGIAESRKSLEKLKTSLQFDNAASNFAKVERAAKGLDLSKIGTSVEKIADKFTLMGMVGVKALERIADRAVNAGERILRSISIDQISAGMNKYSVQTKAVQTITNATGKSVDEVEKVLNVLMKYTDETSYDFVEMANSIGKFTSVGIDLATAEKAMEGIANEAALSGAGKAEANRAMYNFAQALSGGSVKLIDWKSIENANMATKEFKEELISTAIELGTLSKKGDKVGSVMKMTSKATKKSAAVYKETQVDYKSFNQTLSEGWLTTDVLIKTLNRYADTGNALGKKAFEAAQKALTFGDAMDAIKDAVSSGWMQSFKYMFGNLDEAIDLWTNFCNAVIEVTSEISEYRNELLKGWHDEKDGVSGYATALEAVSNVWETFVGILHMVRDTFNEIFPPATSENLVEATKKVKDLTEQWAEFLHYGEDITVEEKGSIVNPLENLVKNLKIGDKGEEVAQLQEELIRTGYLTDQVTADGIYGPKTEAALKKFQKEVGITETGMWDAATRKAASASKTFEVFKEGHWINPLADVEEELKQGDNGKEVRLLQKQLIRTGYLSDKLVADGIYGPETTEALRKFQKDIGVTETGMWDAATIKAAKAKKFFKVWKEGPYEVVKHVGDTYQVEEEVKETVNYAEKLVQVLEEGTRNDYVKELQKNLIRTGYLTDQTGADGIYGPKTKAAVMALQKDLGIKQTGAWDEATKQVVIASGKFSVVETNMKMVTKTVEESSGAMDKFQRILRGVFAILDVGKSALGFVWNVVSHIVGLMAPLFNGLLGLAAVIGDCFDSVDIFLNEGNVWESWLESVKVFLKPFGDAMSAAGKAIDGFLERHKDVRTFSELWDAVVFEFKKKFPEAFDNIVGVINTFKDIIGKAKKAITDFFEGILNKRNRRILENLGIRWDPKNNIFTNIVGVVKGIPALLNYAKDQIALKIDEIKQSFMDKWADFKNGFTERFAFLNPIIEGISKKFQELRDSFLNKKNEKTLQNLGIRWDPKKNVFNNIVEAVKSIPNVFGYLKGQIVGKFNSIIQSISNGFNAFKENVSNWFNDILQKYPVIGSAIEWVKGIIASLATKFQNFMSLFTYDPNRSFMDNLSSNLFYLKIRIEMLFESIGQKVKDFITQNSTIQRMLKVFKGIWTGLLGFFSAVRQSVTNLFKTDTSGEESFFDKLKKKLTSFEPIADWFVNLKDRIVQAWADILALGKKKVGKSGGNDEKSFTGVFDILKNVITAINWPKLLKTAAVGFGIYMLTKIFKFTENFTENITGSFKDLAKAFKAKQDIKDEVLGDKALKIAGAIAIIAAAVGLLSLVDAGKALAGTVVFGIIVGIFVGAIALVNKIGRKDKFKGLSKFGEAIQSFGLGVLMLFGSIAALAVGIGAMAIVLKILSKDIPLLIGTMITVIAFIGLLTLAQIEISKHGGSASTSNKGMHPILAMCIGLIAIAVAIGIVSKAIKKRGSAAWGAFVMLGILLAELGVIAATMLKNAPVSRKGVVKVKGILSMCVGLLVVSFAIGNLAKTIKKYGSSAWGAFTMLVAMMAVMGAVAVLAVKLNGGSGAKVLAPGGSVLLMAIGLSILTHTIGEVLKSIKGINLDVMKTFFHNLIAIFAIVLAVPLIFGALKDFAIPGLLIMIGALALLVIAVGIIISLGISSLEQFGTSLWLFGNSMKDFSNFVEEMNTDSMSAFMAFVKDELVPAVQEIIGVSFDISKIRDFSTNVWLFGVGMNMFYNNVKDITPEVGANVVALCTSASEAIGVLAKATGYDTALDALYYLGAGIVLYKNEVSGIDLTDSVNAKTMAEDVVEITRKLKGIGEVGHLTKRLTDISAAMKLYYAELSEVETVDAEGNEIKIDPEVIQNVFSALSGVTIDDTLIAQFSSYAEEGGSNNLTNFALGIVKLGDAIEDYSTSISGINVLAVMAANGILTKVQDIWSTLNASAPSSETIKLGESFGEGKTNDMTKFIAGIINLGAAIKSYSDNVGGIKNGKIVMANKVIDKMSGLEESLKRVTWTDLLNLLPHVSINENPLAQFGLDLAAMGDAIGKFAEGANGLDDTKARSALNVVDVITKLNEQLPETGGIFNTLFGEKDLGKFSSNLSALGSGVFQFYTNVKDIDEGYSDSKSLAGLKQVADVLWMISNAAINLEQVIPNGLSADVIAANLESLANSFQTQGVGDSFEAVGDSIGERIGLGISDSISYPFEAMEKLMAYTHLAAHPMTLGFKETGAWIVKGLAAGIAENTSIAYNAMRTLGEEVLSSFNVTVSVNSPSEEMRWSGEMLVAGLVEGVSKNDYAARNSMSDLATEAIKGFNDAAGIHSNSDAMIESGEFLVGGITEGVENLKGAAVDALTGVVESGISSVKDKVTDATSGMPDFVQGAVDTAISGLSDKAESAVSNMSGMVGNAFDGLTEKAGDALSGLPDVLGGVFGNSTDVVESALIDMTGVTDSGLVNMSGLMSSWLSAFDLSKWDQSSTDTIFNLGETFKNKLADLNVSDDVKNVFNSQYEDISSSLESGSITSEEAGKKMYNLLNSVFGNIDTSFASDIGSEAMNNFASAFDGDVLSDQLNKTIKRGMRNESVRAMQKELMAAGYDLSKYGADGIFGPETEAAVKAMQKDLGVMITGVWDDATRKAVANKSGYSSNSSEAGRTIISGMSNGMIESEGKAISTIKTIAGHVGLTLRSYYSAFEQAGEYLDSGIAEGIYRNGQAPIHMIRSLGAGLIAAFNAATQINSPSKEFEWSGQMICQGLATGLDKYSYQAGDAAANLANNTMNSANTILGKFSSVMANGVVDGQPSIRPVLDLTDVEYGLGHLDSMLSNQTFGIRSSLIANGIAIRNAEVEASANNGDSGLTASIDNLNERVNELGERISNMSVVLNTGALVGGILPDVDRGLGRMRSGLSPNTGMMTYVQSNPM